MSDEATKKTKSKPIGRLTKILVLVGLAILVLVVIIIKIPEKEIESEVLPTNESAEVQLDRYL